MSARSRRRGRRSASCPAGSASKSSGRNSASPIEREVERVLPHVVHLPADGDERHREPEGLRYGGDEVDGEVAVPER